jgi:hypothetical protein
MEEPYVEGVAIHDGHEPCVCVREGVGEALVVVRAGWAIEPRNRRKEDLRSPRVVPVVQDVRQDIGIRASRERIEEAAADHPGAAVNAVGEMAFAAASAAGASSTTFPITPA